MRDRWASRHGCSLPSLRIMPEQYVLTQPQQCRDFFARHGPRGGVAAPAASASVAATAEGEGPRVWYLKQASGAYTKLHSAKGLSLHAARNLSALHARFGSCSGLGESRDEYMVQAEVPPLLLPGRRKCDLRAFLLVGRASPLFAFAYDGFLRIASAAYSPEGWASQITNAEWGEGVVSMTHEEHYWSLDTLQQFLTRCVTAHWALLPMVYGS